MKKFTFLLSLLLAFVGLTASAQDVRTWKKLASTPSVDNAVTELSQLKDGGTYVFYCTGRGGKYIKIDRYNDLHFGNASTLSADDEQSGLAVFRIHITTSGDQTIYSLESALDGYYMPAASDNNSTGGSLATKTDNPATFYIRTTDLTDNNPVTKTDGSFVIINTANNLGFDMGDNQFCGWSVKGSNCWYKIVPVEVSDETATYCKVTYNVKDGDKTLSTKSEWLKEGATASYSPTTSYYYTLANIENPTVSATNKEFNIAATVGEKPFNANTNYALRINGNRFFEAVNTDGTWNINTMSGNFSASSFDVFGYKIWKFVESGYGVKIYNPYVGKYIKINGNDGSDAATLDDANNATEFYFVQTGSNYALRTATTNRYLNSSVNFNGANNRLGTWTETSISGGSTLVIVDADASADIVAIGKENLTNYFSENYTFGSTADTDKYLTCDNTTRIDAASTTADIFSIYYNPMNISTSALYRVKSVGAAEGNAYLTTDGMFVAKNGSLSTAYYNNIQVNNKSVDRNITRSTADAAFGPQVWQFVKTGNGAYQLKNVNTRCNSAFFNGGNLDMPVAEGYGQSISVKPIVKEGGDNSYASIIWNDKYIGTRGDYYYGVNDNDASDASNIWQIEKVTSVPVAISDVKYASVAYPFATQVTNGVKAYYASAADNGILTLSEYPDGIIPANEGAILFNEEGATTATLNVVTTDNTVENNLLKPATAKRAGFTAEETYVLAKSTASNEAAFLKSELTVVPANKAYIEATSLPTSSEGQGALSFNFGGNVTGINAAVVANKANTEYYDLQGRRVLYPVHGIFVTNTGKKVLVK